MASNLMICTSALKPLSAKKLNESEATGKKYILEGVFAELDKLNRNQRIYPKNEYLKHLAYLRDDIKKGEPLLGELDHPDDRFEPNHYRKKNSAYECHRNYCMHRRLDFVLSVLAD